MNTPDAQSSLESWLTWLQTLSATEIDLGLDRVHAVHDRLGIPEAPRTLVVGGTNGKGSSVAMLDALLRTTGEVTGSYTSPHVLRYNERIRVAGRMVSDAEIVAAFRAVEDVRGDVPLTYFEFGTLAALVVFAEQRVETAILEVGLGGRLDAVNVVEPDATLITNVSLDHCDWLGEDVETIAAEKAGILRAGRPAVFGAPDVPRAITRRAAELRTELRCAGRDFHIVRVGDSSWDWRGLEIELADLDVPALPGRHQLENAAAVLALLEATGCLEPLDVSTVNDALADVSIEGRSQRIDALGRRWLVDGAHNAASAAALGETLRDLAPAGALTVILGILSDKDAAAIVAAIAPYVERWILTAPDSSRAIPARDLAATVEASVGGVIDVADSVALAIDHAAAVTSAGQLIVIAGSFYTAGAALDRLQPYSPTH